MNATVENTLLSTKMKPAACLIRILNAIVRARNETELREALERLKAPAPISPYDYFDWGFGHHHFWLHERTGYKTNNPQRLIIVEF